MNQKLTKSTGAIKAGIRVQVWVPKLKELEPDSSTTKYILHYKGMICSFKFYLFMAALYFHFMPGPSFLSAVRLLIAVASGTRHGFQAC